MTQPQPISLVDLDPHVLSHLGNIHSRLGEHQALVNDAVAALKQHSFYPADLGTEENINKMKYLLTVLEDCLKWMHVKYHKLASRNADGLSHVYRQVSLLKPALENFIKENTARITSLPIDAKKQFRQHQLNLMHTIFTEYAHSYQYDFNNLTPDKFDTFINEARKIIDVAESKKLIALDKLLTAFHVAYGHGFAQIFFYKCVTGYENAIKSVTEDWFDNMLRFASENNQNKLELSKEEQLQALFLFLAHHNKLTLKDFTLFLHLHESSQKGINPTFVDPAYEYELCLMSELPENGDAAENTLYLDNEGNYIVRDPDEKVKKYNRVLICKEFPGIGEIDNNAIYLKKNSTHVEYWSQNRKTIKKAVLDDKWPHAIIKATEDEVIHDSNVVSQITSLCGYNLKEGSWTHLAIKLEISLKNVSNSLKDPTFKKAILDFTSSIGDTRPSYTKTIHDYYGYFFTDTDYEKINLEDFAEDENLEEYILLSRQFLNSPQPENSYLERLLHEVQSNPPTPILTAGSANDVTSVPGSETPGAENRGAAPTPLAADDTVKNNLALNLIIQYPVASLLARENRNEYTDLFPENFRPLLALINRILILDKNDPCILKFLDDPYHFLDLNIIHRDHAISPDELRTKFYYPGNNPYWQQWLSHNKLNDDILHHPDLKRYFKLHLTTEQVLTIIASKQNLWKELLPHPAAILYGMHQENGLALIRAKFIEYQRQGNYAALLPELQNRLPEYILTFINQTRTSTTINMHAGESAVAVNLHENSPLLATSSSHRASYTVVTMNEDNVLEELIELLKTTVELLKFESAFETQINHPRNLVRCGLIFTFVAFATGFAALLIYSINSYSALSLSLFFGYLLLTMLLSNPLLSILTKVTVQAEEHKHKIFGFESVKTLSSHIITQLSTPESQESLDFLTQWLDAYSKEEQSDQTPSINNLLNLFLNFLVLQPAIQNRIAARVSSAEPASEKPRIFYTPPPPAPIAMQTLG